MNTNRTQRGRGYTLVELLVTIAVFTLVFGGLFASIQFVLKLVSSSKAATSALSIANERMEYIRSLSYNSIGTKSGIPNGPIPQHATSSLNGITFHERTLIQYVDSPDDGMGASDVNGILADYKQVKVEISWLTEEGTSTVYLLSNVVPPGIETTAGGGTLKVNVFDASVLPIQGASVRVQNKTTTSTIDVTMNTNVDGIAMFSGAPAAANYEITVTKAGYSTDKTYVATTSNPNPTTLPIAVIESAVSTMNFQIDRLSNLLVRTVEPKTTGSTTDTFADASLIHTQIDTVLSSGDIVLAGGAGSYLPTGTIHGTGTTPTPLERWDSASWNATVPLSGTLMVQVYSVSGGVFTLVPDAVLPGNSVGFSENPIDLTPVSVITYPTLALGATFTTSNVNETPALKEWSIEYTMSEPVLPSIPFTLTSAKTIGTDAALVPIPKYTSTFTTDLGGETQLSDLEWGSYAVTLGTALYDVKEACGDIPYALDPGVSDTLTLTLVPDELYTYRVNVVDANGNPISGAQVELSRPGPSWTRTTSSCGQVFFNTGLGANVDYEIEVSKAGYATQTFTPLEIDGDETLRVTLVP